MARYELAQPKWLVPKTSALDRSATLPYFLLDKQFTQNLQECFMIEIETEKRLPLIPSSFVMS